MKRVDACPPRASGDRAGCQTDPGERGPLRLGGAGRKSPLKGGLRKGAASPSHPQRTKQRSRWPASRRGAPQERLRQWTTPNEAAASDARTGRRSWRAVRATSLLVGLGLVGVLMVDPPIPFGEAAAAQAYVRAANRWITLGAEDPSSSPAETTSAPPSPPRTPSPCTPSPHTRTIEAAVHARTIKGLHKRSVAENTSRSMNWGDSRNSRKLEARSSDILRSRSHRTTRTPTPTYRSARTSALQSPS